jgi:murein DD-endopeptidase MepM/ murein hydrolase activator NlpD
MAVISSGINVDTIRSSLSSSQRGISGAAQTAKKVETVILNQSKIRSSIFSRSSTLRARRLENSKRQQIEEELELGSIAQNNPAAIAFRSIQSSTKGFLGRILDAIGYITAGWLLENLPTWIAMGTEFIARIKKTGEIITNIFGNMYKAISSFGNILTGIGQNLLQFDLLDSSRRVQSSFDELYSAMDQMGFQIEEGYKMLSTPLDQSIPGTESQQEESLYGPTQYSGGGGDASDLKSGARLLMQKGFPAKGAAYLAGNIQTESEWKAKRKPWVLNDGAGTNKGLISWNRTRITSAEKFLGKPLEQAGAGEQIEWIKEELKQYGLLKVFMDPKASEEQLKVASKQYIGWGKLGARWEHAQTAYQFLQKEGPGPALVGQSGQPGQFQPGQIQPGRQLRSGDVLTRSIGKGVSYIQITDAYNARSGTHKGVDIAAPSGTYIALRYDCEVIFAGPSGDYGNVMDVWVPQLSVQLRLAHLSAILVRSGKIKAGTSFARVGSTGRSSGPHIHFEYSTQKGSMNYGGSGNPSGYVNALLLTNTPNQGSFATPAVTSPAQTTIPSAQIMTNTPTGQQLAQEVTPERQGRKMIFIDDRGSASTQVSTYGSGATSQQMPMPEGEVLNNFIKKKLLLDLAYL